MGCIAHCSDSVLERYTQAVLSAMMAGLEDPTDHKGKTVKQTQLERRL